MDARPGPGFPATLHLERTACAPFHEERRMKLTEATKFHRKSGQGLGINSEDDLSAGGAALNLAPLATLSLGAKPRDLQFQLPLRKGHLLHWPQSSTLKESRNNSGPTRFYATSPSPSK